MRDYRKDYQNSQQSHCSHIEGHNVPDVVKEHQKLIQIIEHRDVAAIEPLLKQHLYGGVRRMGGELFSDKYKSYFKSVNG